MKKIAIGSDHGGFELKQKVIRHLEEKGYQCEDKGCYSRESCDYPFSDMRLQRQWQQGKQTWEL